ncbi:putative calcium-binding protein CML25 [Tasmannia lanceolata]|uniref:putative calcium-binding protein CML25 n=1 Tax=Tasmannia lanceolata TaxID=3420 RepID=UPI0040645AD6
MGIRSFFTKRKKSKSSLKTSQSAPTSPHGEPILEHSVSSKTQIEELKDVFRKFDANGDGKISWSELGSIMGSLGQPATEEELQRMVKEVDFDGDGFIDLDEFIELNTRGVDTKTILEDLKHAFLIYDIDGNGSISPGELQKVLRSLGDEISMAECKRMISGVDSDGDGLIDFEEFKNMMTRSMPLIPSSKVGE